MKANFKLWNSFAVVLLIVVAISCSKDESADPSGPIDTDQDGIIDANDDCPNASGPASNNGCPETTSETSLAEVIALGTDPEQFPNSRSETVEETFAPTNEDYDKEVDDGSGGTTTQQERFICTTERVSVTDGNSEFPLFDVAADVIYPGALLQGKSIADGVNPAPIPVARGEGTISYNLINANLDSSFYVDEVSKSSIQNGMNAIIAGAIAAGQDKPADNFNIEYHSIEQEEQLALELGVKFETFASEVQSELAFSTDRNYNRTLVKMTQSFYTMTYDIPTSIDEFFAPSVTPEQLSTYVQPDNPATFISSVVYGRIFYMLIESTSSRQKMDAELRATYGGVKGGVSGEVEASSFNSLENVRIKVIAYGGRGSAKLLGVTNINEIANLLDESSDIRSGLPLSYTVRSVNRPDKIVGTTLATSYNKVTCELKGLLAPGNYEEIGNLFEEGIGAAMQLEGTNLIFYNKSGTKYAWYNVADGGETKKIFDIDDPLGPMGASTFTAIGAAVHYNTGIVYVYNEEGNKAELLRYNEPSLASNTLPDGPIGQYDQQNGSNRQWVVDLIFTDQGGNYPFAGENIGAGCMYFTYQESGTDNFYFVKEGDRYAGYDPVTGVWGGVNLTKNWAEGGANQMPFDNISAVCLVSFSPTIKRQLFFNISGDEFTIWNPEETNTQVNQFSAPWVCGN